MTAIICKSIDNINMIGIIVINVGINVIYGKSYN